MFDPAAIGTLLIGLNAERAEAQNDRRSRAVPVRRSHRTAIRMTFASGLRRAAALLDRPRIGEASQ